MANILNIDKVEPTDIEIESSIHYKLNRCRYHKVIRLVQQTKYKNNCDRMCGIGENKMFEKKYIFIYLQIKNIGFLIGYIHQCNMAFRVNKCYFPVLYCAVS